MNMLRQNNQLQNIQLQETRYKAGGTEITLSPSLVRQYLVSGGGNVTDAEVLMFIALCKAQGLNPWVRDAYLIKYQGNKPAQAVTGIGAFEKRADTFPEYAGMKSGIIVYNSQNGNIGYRDGCFYLPAEEVVGGWAEVHRKDRTQPTHIEVAFHEYAGRKGDGSLNNMWASKPAVMIRKVAKATALREAFPRQNSGLYVTEELGMEDAQPAIPEEVASQMAQPEAQPMPDTEPVRMDPRNEKRVNPFI